MNHILTPEDCINTYEMVIASQANANGNKVLILQVNVNNKYINPCFLITSRINGVDSHTSASTLKEAKELYNNIVL